ncbi:hypothetical protein FRB90_004159 [Tulasnella sp. 427]|nr:hypothetical protein FRB90_004159 [Tulasnella sp. 427]
MATAQHNALLNSITNASNDGDEHMETDAGTQQVSGPQMPATPDVFLTGTPSQQTAPGYTTPTQNHTTPAIEGAQVETTETGTSETPSTTQTVTPGSTQQGQTIAQPNWGSANDHTPTPSRTLQIHRQQSNVSLQADTNDPQFQVGGMTLDQKKQVLAAYRQQRAMDEVATSTGSVSFPKQAYPRCVGSRSLRTAYLMDDEACLSMAYYTEQNMTLLWAVAYKTVNPTHTEGELLSKGLLMVEGLMLVKDYAAVEYRVIAPPPGAKCLLIVAKNVEAAKRLYSNRIITTETSWGSHIVVDIYGGGADFLKDVLPKFYKTFRTAILVKESKPGYVTFNDLKYHKVPYTSKSHKGSKMVVWRVSFKYTQAATDPQWTIPRTIGTSSRGVIEVKRPPFCPHCCALVHEQSLCEWWKEGLMAGTKTRPVNFIETEWSSVEPTPEKKLK